MATSKILHMKDSGKSFHGRHLKESIKYITAPEKTQGQRLVNGWNCSPDCAFAQMMDTKGKFQKITGRQGYHIIISFAENEIDADTAFELTGKFVREYLGHEYEAVYAVHDNTEHIHAHIVFNSISFLTGNKYRYQKGDWAKFIQPITNRLCQEYGLSTIEIENEKAGNEYYKEWNVYRDGPFVWADMIKKDIDAAIAKADSYEYFLASLQYLGYEVKQGKYVAVKPPGLKRFKRLKTLGDQYAEEAIRRRIFMETEETLHEESVEDAIKIVSQKLPKAKRAKLTPMQKNYYARLYRLGLLKRRPYSQVWKYRDEIRRMEKLQEEYLFLIKHDIASIAELEELKETLRQDKKAYAAQKTRIFREKKKSENLFVIADEMKDYLEAERAFQMGDETFLEEHEKWKELELCLEEKHQSYETVQMLRDYYKKEMDACAEKVRALAKEERILNRITEEDSSNRVIEKEKTQKQTRKR
ncbi:Relaxase/Mobilisation nuclease domain-containing protein [Lachnospiraceae bacterium XBB1006]|nr:Relaxase/Mobilisation nuclease domain-containing protein [Lachnospiraceae bacterium XBB1006]